MKSGGPWNLRGLRPETREAARDAARRAGMSVGEWLNNVVQQGDDNHGEPMGVADYDDHDDDWRDEPRHEPRQESRRDHRREQRRGPRHEQRQPRHYREHESEIEHEPRRQQQRERKPEYASEPRRHQKREREVEIERESALAREEFGEVHARLDRLTQQLERIAQSGAPRLTGAPVPQQRGQAPPPRPRNGIRPTPYVTTSAVDDAIAEIAERQRTLYSEALSAAPPAAAPLPQQAVTPPPAPAPFVPSTAAAPEPTVDISNLDEQLRYITSRIESLRPSSDLEKVIKSFRKDLAEIREQITVALPRRAVESLEIEVQALAQRLNHSRDSGVDLGVLAGLERGLGEVRDALHSLTPAENLAGFDEAVRTLAQKVDLIIAKEDPAALQQLETAIGALRGIVSHVASNDTLTKVAEDVRSLAAKVDGVANSAASGLAVSALESRIDTLTNALNASQEAGQSVPRELEKLLSGLIEKLEWVQLTHTDHAALGALEDRIAQLIKRLDTSDARLGNLEAVERGLADLLVHIDQIRGGNAAPAAAMRGPVVADSIEREVRRTQDSLEAVHGAVEHVVDRLAMIESGMHDGAARADTRDEPPAAAEAASAPEPTPMASVVIPTPAASDPASRRSNAPRPPLDPNLPPDHPLEPGSAPGTRATPSAAERIAASEAAVGLAKPPVIPAQGEKTNFIAAARRAAQAAAAAPPERQTRADRAAFAASGSEKPSRLRKILVAGGAVIIAVACMHIALRVFQDRTVQNHTLQDSGPAATPKAPSQQPAPPAVLPESNSPGAASSPGPLILPVPGGSSDTAPNAPPLTTAPKPLGAAPEALPHGNPDTAPAMPQRQSALHNLGDITGALPRRVPPPPQAAPPASITEVAPPQASAPAMVTEKLPAMIGGPKLRAAAIAGDAAAEFEVATRFADGHGVPPNQEEALRWLELAAKQGLAPAQFRLGGLYEKGIGVKKDLALARDFYAAAAAKGNAKAMHNLAVLYAEGINGPADYRTAVRLFRMAADRGITDSQYNLAILYARGIGVEQNYAESYKWFALAASKGDSDAAKKRDEVAAHLDAQALAAAKIEVQKWAPQPQPADAIGVKAPPGGWDLAQHAEKSKARSSATKSAANLSGLY